MDSIRARPVRRAYAFGQAHFNGKPAKEELYYPAQQRVQNCQARLARASGLSLDHLEALHHDIDALVVVARRLPTAQIADPQRMPLVARRYQLENWGGILLARMGKLAGIDPDWAQNARLCARNFAALTQAWFFEMRSPSPHCKDGLGREFSQKVHQALSSVNGRVKSLHDHDMAPSERQALYEIETHLHRIMLMFAFAFHKPGRLDWSEVKADRAFPRLHARVMQATGPRDAANPQHIQQINAFDAVLFSPERPWRHTITTWAEQRAREDVLGYSVKNWRTVYEHYVRWGLDALLRQIREYGPRARRLLSTECEVLSRPEKFAQLGVSVVWSCLSAFEAQKAVRGEWNAAQAKLMVSIMNQPDLWETPLEQGRVFGTEVALLVITSLIHSTQDLALFGQSKKATLFEHSADQAAYVKYLRALPDDRKRCLRNGWIETVRRSKIWSEDDWPRFQLAVRCVTQLLDGPY